MSERLYTILNIQPDADAATIKRAYRKLALQYHPDKNSDPGSEERFKDISEAYDILSDPQKKATYDRGGDQPINHKPFDMFNMFFNHKGKNASAKKDVLLSLNIDLADAYTGLVKLIPTHITVICTACEGTGGAGAVTTCITCDGKGMTIKLNKTGFLYEHVQSSCIECKGTGEKIDLKLCCDQCKGKKTTKEKKILNVTIPKGMKSTHKIRFQDENKCSATDSSNIIITVNINEHATFQRHDDDLFMNLDINLTEALCGFSRALRTLDNRIIFIKYNEDVIKPNTLKCIHNEGMPILNNPYEKGKLIIQFNIIFPLHVDSSKLLDLETIIGSRKQFKHLDTYERVSLNSYDLDQTTHQSAPEQCPIQ
jgi:DnaJ-class molecular chaperone